MVTQPGGPIQRIKWYNIVLITCVVVTVAVLITFFILWILWHGHNNNDDNAEDMIRGITDSNITFDPNPNIDGDTRLYAGSMQTESDETGLVISIDDLVGRSMAITITDLMTMRDGNKETSTITNIYDVRFDMDDNVSISEPDSNRIGAMELSSVALSFTTINIDVIDSKLNISVTGVVGVPIDHYVSIQIISAT